MDDLSLTVFGEMLLRMICDHVVTWSPINFDLRWRNRALRW